MNCILFDSSSYTALFPLTATRPISTLRIGILTIEEKWKKYLNLEIYHLCRKELSELYSLQLEESNLFISGNVIPDRTLVDQLINLNSEDILVDQDGDVVALQCSRSEYVNLGATPYENIVQTLVNKRSNRIQVQIQRLKNPWQIFQWNDAELRKDYKLLTYNRNSFPIDKTNTVIGHDIFLEEGAIVQCSILNSNTGPIYIAKDAEIMEGSMIRGPLALGEQAVLKLGTKIYGATSIGKACKIGGEVNNSVFLAHSNKAHDGFIGNSVIGEWCNIGADSNNSNLKNTYSEVKLWNYEKKSFMNTGTIFCGLIMGDHAKCGINTMFNTGTVVGVGANIFGAGYPRQFIPDFTWGGASGFKTFRFEEFLETAEAVMSRRNVSLDEAQIEMLRTVFNNTSVFRNWEK